MIPHVTFLFSPKSQALAPFLDYGMAYSKAHATSVKVDVHYPAYRNQRSWLRKKRVIDEPAFEEFLAARKPDLVMATSDAIAIEVLRTRRENGPLVVANAIGLTLETYRASLDVYRKADQVLCFSKKILGKLEAEGLTNLRFMRFATDFEYFEFSPTKKDYVVNFDDDVKRDWHALDRLAHALPTIEFKIIGAHRNPFTSPNIEYLGDLPHEQSREWLREARACVLTTFDNDYFSGLTTVLSAAACGTPCVAPRDENVEGYETLAGHFFEREANAAAMAVAVMKAWDEGISRADYDAFRSEYGFPQLLRQYETLWTELLAQKP